jgi:hypothetical protein
VNPAAGFTLALPLGNPFPHQLHADLTWNLPEGEPWTVEPRAASADVPTGTTNTLVFTLSCTGAPPWQALPRCEARLAAGDAYAPRDPITIPWPAETLLRVSRPTTEAPQAASAPVIDGLLDDPAWAAAKPIEDFRHPDLRQSAAHTTARVIYDAAALYISLRCEEPNMAALRIGNTTRDGDVWLDDAVEIMVGTNAQDDAYLHFAANANGVLYDADRMDRHYNGGARAAAARDKGGWGIEFAIPWADLGGAPPVGLMSLQLVRDRAQDAAILQYPPLNGSNHRRDLHGFLRLMPQGAPVPQAPL